MDFMNKVAAAMVVSTTLVATAFAAVEVPAELTQIDATDNSVSFTWTPVDGAFGYYIYWGEGSADNFGEFVSDPEYTLTGLDAGRDYRVSVTAIDENEEESEKAPEVVMSTANSKGESFGAEDDISASKDFGLARIELLSESEVNLIFTKKLDENQDLADQILLEKDNGELIEMDNVSFGLTSNTIVSALPQELETNSDYKFTILALQDSEGNVIENGIDAVTNFTTPSEFKSGEVVVIDTKENKVEIVTTEELAEEKNIELEEELAQEEMPELDAAGLEKKSQEGLTKDKEKTTKTSEVAKTADSLPEAGAEHILLLLLALCTAAGFAFYSTNKNK